MRRCYAPLLLCLFLFYLLPTPASTSEFSHSVNDVVERVTFSLTLEQKEEILLNLDVLGEEIARAQELLTEAWLSYETSSALWRTQLRELETRLYQSNRFWRRRVMYSILMTFAIGVPVGFMVGNL